MSTRRTFIRLTGMAALSGLSSKGFLFADKAAKDGAAGITFFGAAGRVSGSMALVALPGDKAIIDCGSFYDEGGDASALNVEMPVEALDASILLLTHAHADHVSRILLLIERGFKGMIAATEPTLSLLKVMLIMSARYSGSPLRTWTWSNRKTAPVGRIEVFKLHWHPKCRWSALIKKSNLRNATGPWAELKKHTRLDKAEASPCEVCAAHEVELIISRCKSVSVGKPFSIGTHTTVTATQAGHLPGSVSFHLESTFQDGRKRSMLFSGDLGPKDPLLQHGFGKPPAADAIVIECTYGTKPLEVTRDAALAFFRSRLISHLKRGSAVWIPSFALDRTEKVLMQIEVALREAGSKLPRLPEVYVPSPSANTFHDLYHKGGEGWDLRKGYLNLEGRTRRGGPTGYHDRMPDAVNSYLGAIKAKEMDLPDFANPAILAPAAMSSLAGNIVLTTSGMISESFSEALFKPLVSMETTAIFLVGYQDPQSTGGKLKATKKDGKTFLEIDGKQIEVKAAVEDFSGFSGHAYAVEIDEWLHGQSIDSRLFLVHGNPENLQARGTELEKKGWKNVSIPRHRQHFNL